MWKINNLIEVEMSPWQAHNPDRTAPHRICPIAWCISQLWLSVHSGAKLNFSSWVMWQKLTVLVFKQIIEKCIQSIIL